QHALVDALAFDDHPNLFIVGDEKQAIFGFQGADVSHFGSFLERYPRTARIALSENYRSYQEVLDVAEGLLAELPSAVGAHAPLTATRGAGGRIRLLAAPDPLAERDQVATLVEEAIAEGVPPHELAVITLKNKTADLFALHLRARGIPVLRAGDIDLDGRPLVRTLFALMRATGDPTDASALREALLAPWWNVPLAERARFLRTTNDRELETVLEEAFPAVAGIIAALREEALAVPPANFFSLLLAQSGARDYLLSHADALTEDVPLVRKVMQYVEELVRRAPSATFAEVVAEFEQAREHEVGALTTSRTRTEGAVTVITAHKAKGMEFARVFVTALTKSEWEGRGKSALVPSPFDGKREHDELIRLFYVATTRAKDALVLSYAAENGDGKEQPPFSLMPAGLETLSVPSDPLPKLFTVVEPTALLRELTERYLVHDGLSPSAYNEYLESPPAFFAKRVLRLSEPETRAIAAGNAVHAALARFLKTRDADEAHAELARAFRQSLLPRGDTFDALVRHGSALLRAALADPFFAGEALAIEETFKAKRVVRGTEVALKGKIDALMRTDEGLCIVDFKTSSSIGKEEKERFARQIAFYDLLLRANGHEPVSGRIVRLSEEGIEEHRVLLAKEMRTELEATLDAVLEELLTGRWRAGAPSDYDALFRLLA
ncbi:MAG: ATP-dependent helicase, partial [Patescibacteria group bacterium]|nr:ATP-dependent helicase [Patescibacteria group bacterium]